ncbi:LysM peptidoglycan-binding domain-containing protein [Halopseudomonas laoshanensis]|uniref:LysM peptidoglycan-binding domain-containing protein n=1 Tax=Halopseudomonas laoshanensis TaxID=2268758 RepID=UPI0015B539C1|nr:LysM domain-containing protein [Halopseudomonas laoshanensis]
MEYIVRSGDSLSLIAKANGTTVATLMRLNPEIGDANRIHPQQRIRLPEPDKTRQTRSIGQVADCSACADEYVDLLHQAEEGIFVPLTAEHQREIEQEEAVLHQLIHQFYEAMENTEDNILAFKDGFVERLQQERIIDSSKPSEPMQLTEIRRLKGNNHYAYVRKDSGWRRHRSYSIEAQDRARAKGWYDPESGAINGQKLAETIAQDMNKPSLKLTLHQSFVDWCLLEWQNDPARWTPVEGMQPIVVGAQAQAMRFAMGASLQSGYDPRKLSAHIAAKASASASLAEGKAYATTTWPAEDESEWLIYYRDQNNQRQAASLGKFRAKVSAELVGFSGASAMLSAEVHVAMNNGIPQLRGVGDSNRNSRNGEPASVEAGAFAGVRADGKLEGSIEWQDTLVEVPRWKALSTLGVGVGAALGLGAEARLRIGWSKQTHKFYFNVHAGLVVGGGASGEFGAEVNAEAFGSLVKFIYNALLGVDFHKVEEIEAGAFNQLTSFAVFGVLSGTGHAVMAARLGQEAAERVEAEVQRFIQSHRTAREREILAITTAENTLLDLAKGEDSWIRYAPPEVKGQLLEILCFDYGPTFWDRLTAGFNSRERAILTLLELSQSWRDYEETVTRISTNGRKTSFTLNRSRLKNLMRLFPGLQMDRLESRLSGTRATPNQPVKLAKHIQLSGTHYA